MQLTLAGTWLGNIELNFSPWVTLSHAPDTSVLGTSNLKEQCVLVVWLYFHSSERGVFVSSMALEEKVFFKIRKLVDQEGKWALRLYFSCGELC